MARGTDQFVGRAASSSALAFMARGRAWLSPIDFERVLPFASAVYLVAFLVHAHVYDGMFEKVMSVFLVVYIFDLHRRLRRSA
ncbi:MAG: hypothetical protein CL566_08985 [Alphaproteobacteria bacterium]|nr:hypothetical protein [Alphaproteobacteria bacterium]|tara:strand:- start:1029 stop:1277 length:249 start_codon:yes stop_codon:yes gene_type:complete